MCPLSPQTCRTLLTLLQGMATSWISKEGFDTGIVSNVLRLVSEKPDKSKKKVAGIIIPVLLVHATSFPSELNAALFA